MTTVFPQEPGFPSDTEIAKMEKPPVSLATARAVMQAMSFGGPAPRPKTASDHIAGAQAGTEVVPVENEANVRVDTGEMPVVLSPESRMYLNDIAYALKTVKDSLLASGGTSIDEPQVSGVPFAQFYASLPDKIGDVRQLDYVMDHTDRMIKQLNIIQTELAKEPEESKTPRHRA